MLALVETLKIGLENWLSDFFSIISLQKFKVMTYQEQLKSPKWQKKRLEILERDNFTCSYCGSTEKQLHVHHGYYDKNVKLWDYEDETMHTLCYYCHNLSHEYLEQLKHRIAYFNPKYLLELNEIITSIFFHKDKDVAIENIIFFFNTINGYNKK